ncbi:hypothetical protein BOTBODRAFT_65417 [Botryobasidium botryosum FD-172 SS1]|uniref:Uncharacterized protein n=1 Tax=Botryobasidium botryosum (strain FD-172 SS1) TaxID=930990 RepID=A0A067MJ08_BOTB1|nr:hypothetical protein BOTBODRAFT_65417 [Botryobasidium botryosum FD-172 SS1]
MGQRNSIPAVVESVDFTLQVQGNVTACNTEDAVEAAGQTPPEIKPSQASEQERSDDDTVDEVPPPIRGLGDIALYNYERATDIQRESGFEAIPRLIRLHVGLFERWILASPLPARVLLVGTAVAIGLGFICRR